MIYVIFIRSERYESSSALIVKDINDQNVAAMGLGILTDGVSSQMQDSKILEEYLRSYDILKVVDEHFDLKKYYHSSELDPMTRLYGSSSEEDFLQLYRNNLNIFYDEVSGILQLGFSHTDPLQAQKIAAFLIAEAEKQLNRYNERNAQKQLEFVQEQVEKNRRELDASTMELEAYQNEHLMLNPETDAQTQSGIIADLEATLVQKRSEYNQMQRYMSESSFDLIKLAHEINELESALKKTKQGLTGSDNSRLNAILFAYEKLKTKVELDTEIYKESLVQLEAARIDANKEAKTLLVLTQPNLPDSYTYPDKPKVLITLLILFGLGYGIIWLTSAIIKDHKD